MVRRRRRRNDFVDFAGNTWEDDCGCGRRRGARVSDFDCGCGSHRNVRATQCDCGCDSRRGARAGAMMGNRGFNDDDALVDNASYQVEEMHQGSHEVIEIIDSCDVDVTSNDTQIALSIQVAIQIAIAVVVNITIADSNRAEQVTNDLLQRTEMRQINKQKVRIEGSKDVNVTTSDTDIALSLQVLVQVLLAFLIQLDIL
ncbi:spore coat protein [Virgibacillus sp. MSP4-1]|uniref:spore coat protein n=1 Tax=Virgibacillus sp. MSP4-1 TaxID=2700081 RepID=UPI0003A717E7|nr:spore coat protein [Virgibacillus sp. MSP4-1]